MKNIFTIDNLKKTWGYAVNHKIKAACIVAISILTIYYGSTKFFGTNTTGTRYITGTVTKSTIISSVTGTGQVSSSNQIDLKGKVSGDITGIYVKTGQEVKGGTLIAKLDARDAEINLESAQIAYQKLTKSADPKNIEDSKAVIEKSYADAWNTAASVFTNYPSIVTSMNDLLYTKTGFLSNEAGFDDRNQIANSYIRDTETSFDRANDSYKAVLLKYNTLSSHSSKEDIDSLLSLTLEMVKLMTIAVKDAQTSITYIGTIQSAKNEAAGTSAANTVNNLSGTTNGYISNIVSAQNAIKSSENSLTTLLEGADSLDVQSSALSVAQRQSTLSDYYVRAPFDGIIASVAGKVGGSGSETIATLITKEKYADISLNEVDAAKVLTGQKATVTFDAIDGLSIAGEVAEINLVGTVSQGVVTYNVKIKFDTDDARIKPGMSVSAAIVTNIAQDVLTVPASAIKTQNGQNYVLAFNPNLPEDTTGQGIASSLTPTQIPVEVGISDDTSTEIKSGLKENDQIVVKTTTAATTKTTTAPSLFSAAGARTGGTNGTRALGR